jgi:uncharacterized protein YidB (DUF937 family)
MRLGNLGLALVGLLAYQNRDKIAEVLRAKLPTGDRSAGQPGNLFESVVGGTGLGELLERFRTAGTSEQVDSWVGRGENQPLTREQVQKAIDPQTMEELARQTGFSKEDLIDRIARDLPDAVDKVTPGGQLPPQGPSPRGPNLLDDVPTP